MRYAIFLCYIFILFLPVVLIIYYNPMIQNRQFQNIFLLIASVFFYAWGEPVYVYFAAALDSVSIICWESLWKIFEIRRMKKCQSS